ncbi:hypothetical protein OEA41_008000 [Lepraria neglecta]|uniref:Hexosyltransferase n=1 Tax=Lepraria neglecta TaxID=209136 RepID=A0AAD9ZEM0_9LECA|nr:hypothetical protein OEA41_008000 [Lepraria neglecta]
MKIYVPPRAMDGDPRHVWNFKEEVARHDAQNRPYGVYVSLTKAAGQNISLTHFSIGPTGSLKDSRGPKYQQKRIHPRHAITPHSSTTFSEPGGCLSSLASGSRPSIQRLGNNDEDEYFVGTRVLAYQLLHAPNTCTNSSIDFVVLATPDIPKSKLDRLRKDGATVKVVEKIHEKWMKPGLVRWRDMLSKLHMWKLVEYEKALFLDADMLIAKRMDGIFTDPTAAPLK